MDRAEAVGVREIALFTAASETFNRRNINASIEESFTRFAPVIARAKRVGMRVRGYVSCAFGCPYEGVVRPEAVAEVSARLVSSGCDEVSIGDTIGVGVRPRCRRWSAAPSRPASPSSGWRFTSTTRGGRPWRTSSRGSGPGSGSSTRRPGPRGVSLRARRLGKRSHGRPALPAPRHGVGDRRVPSGRPRRHGGPGAGDRPASGLARRRRPGGSRRAAGVVHFKHARTGRFGFCRGV